MASEIVHITFEKLTGLKGTIEGWFECHPEAIDETIPLILINDDLPTLVFEQAEDNFIYITPVEPVAIPNFKEHFQYGVNFLIKEWSYGRGASAIKHSISPN